MTSNPERIVEQLEQDFQELMVYVTNSEQRTAYCCVNHGLKATPLTREAPFVRGAAPDPLRYTFSPTPHFGLDSALVGHLPRI